MTEGRKMKQEFLNEYFETISPDVLRPIQEEKFLKQIKVQNYLIIFNLNGLTQTIFCDSDGNYFQNPANITL